MPTRNSARWFLVSALVFSVWACEPAPDREMAEAERAKQEALDAQADAYAPEILQQALDALDSATAEVEAQEVKLPFFRDYDRARELLTNAKSAADIAKTDADTKREAARQAAHEAIEAAQTALNDAQAAISNRRHSTEIASEMEALTQTLANARKDLEQAQFSDAASKADTVMRQTDRISIDGLWAGSGPHALLFPTGTRFETTATNQLAVHGPVTIEFWIKIAKPSSGVFEIGLHNFKFWIRETSLTFLVQSSHSLRRPDLGVGVWRHVAGTFDGTTSRLFVDGVEVANTKAFLAGNSLSVQAQLVLHEAASPAPVVTIDDLRVWKDARSKEQIRRDIVTAPPDSDGEAGLLAFGFNEGEGQFAHNAFDNHGDAWLGKEPGRPDPADPIWVADTPASSRQSRLKPR